MRSVVIKAALLSTAVSSAYAANNFTEVGNSFAEDGSCPQTGFLIQDSTASLYEVNLATGHYQVGKGVGLKRKTDMTVSDYMTPRRDRLNALAYNVHDDYLYAWMYEENRLAKIGTDYEAVPIEMTSPDGFRFRNEASRGGLKLPNFFVGDICLDPDNQAYYGYNDSKNNGLFRVELDQSSENFGQMTKVFDQSELNIAIFDMAFHPDYENDPKAYSVDRLGDLYSINVSTGETENMGNIGIRGTFGSVYFGINEEGNARLYVSRNHDGKIFEVDVSAEDLTAVLKAQGPLSGNNDGARCATASVSFESIDRDYGDAPSSYDPEGNEASHQLDIADNVWLGGTVDAESKSFAFPLSDDESGDIDDEDGIQLIGNLKEGRNAVMLVKANADTGTPVTYLHAWIDLDQDGEFDTSERIIHDSPILANGSDKPVFISIPSDSISETGEYWARFRLVKDSTDNLAPTGAAGNGEVEDMLLTITNNQDVSYVDNYYPSPQNSVTLMYEDLWPIQGDYDMNDLVVYYRTKQTVDKTRGIDEVVSTTISGSITAVGAAYANGFAVRIPGLTRDNVDEEKLRLTLNGDVVTSHASGNIGHKVLEAGEGSDDAIIIITPNILDVVLSGEGCTDPYSGYSFYRTLGDCAEAVALSFEVHVPFDIAIEQGDLPLDIYDPFIYASGEDYRSDQFSFIGRGLEIHLQGKGYTPLMNTQLFGMNEDASDGLAQPGARNFVNENGMPWAMMVNFEWKHPFENVDTMSAFHHFENFVSSSGEEYSNWFDHNQNGYADLDSLYLD